MSTHSEIGILRDAAKGFIMGRKPTVNLNLPPNMRARTKQSGRTYYYFDCGFVLDGETRKRKEIPLGDDYVSALRRYTELAEVDTNRVNVTFKDVIDRYKTEILPNLSKNTQHTTKYDLIRVGKNFDTAPLEEVRPMHVKKFLDKYKNTPTTANRGKRLISALWNYARGWGYTDLPNPCEGIKGHELDKREVYMTDSVFAAIWQCASEPLRDAMDLAYLTGQRPVDALKMTAHDIQDGYLLVKQSKTKAKLRIAITGGLDELLKRIKARKDSYKVHHTALLVNMNGRALTYNVLNDHFVAARKEAVKKFPDLAAE